jgi:drug/metabolite transporter (DMT)-like permease
MKTIFVLLFIMSLVETFSFIELKNYSIYHNFLSLGLGSIGYMYIAFLLAKLFELKKLGIVIHSWNIVTTCVGFLLGYLLYNETITAIELLGALLSMVGVFLMIK